MATTAEAAQSYLAFIEETIPGETPSTPTLKKLRKVDENLKSVPKIGVSKEKNSDRQVSGQYIVGGDTTGNISGELSFETYDTSFEHVFMNSFTVPQTITGPDLSLSGAQLLSAASAFEAAKNAIGQHLKIKDSVPASNNGIFKITGFAANALTLEKQDGTVASFTADSANAALSYSSSALLRNGTTKKAMTLERGLTDVNEYFQYSGIRTNSMTIEMNEESEISVSFEVMGKLVTLSNVTIDNSGTVSPPTVTPVMNAAGNVELVKEANTEFPGTFKRFSISLNNNPTKQTGVGVKDLIGVSVGDCTVEISGNAYFEDVSLYTKLLQNTASSFNFFLVDSSSNRYIISMYNVGVKDVDIPVSEGDVMQDVSCQAYKDPVTGYTIQIDKISAS